MKRVFGLLLLASSSVSFAASVNKGTNLAIVTVDAPTTTEDGDAVCSKSLGAGSKFAAIDSLAKFDELKAATASDDIALGAARQGLRFVWKNNVDVDKVNSAWAANEPSLSGDCVVRRADAEWYAVDCASQVTMFACELPSGEVRDGYHNGNSLRFRVFKEGISMKDAEDWCAAQDGLISLGSIRKETDIPAIAGVIDEKQWSDVTFWVGGKRNAYDADFSWADGNDIDGELLKWRAGYPRSTSGDCVVLDGDGITMRNVQCDDRHVHGVICAEEDTVLSPRFAVLTTKSVQDATSAELACEQRGYHLATLANDLEVEEVRLVYDEENWRTDNFDAVVGGAGPDGGPQQFSGVSGYVSAAQQPKSIVCRRFHEYQTEHFAVVRLLDAVDYNAAETFCKKHYLLSDGLARTPLQGLEIELDNALKENGYGSDHVWVDGRDDEDGQCSYNVAWDLAEHEMPCDGTLKTLACHVPQGMKNTENFVIVRDKILRTAEEATEYCGQNFGTSLATIDSSEKQEEIAELVGETAESVRLWIGATDGETESVFRWSGTGGYLERGFENWAKNEPDDRCKDDANKNCQPQDCAFLDPADGKWSDFQCEHALAGFVCDLPPLQTVYFTLERQTREGAEEACAAYGGRLLDADDVSIEALERCNDAGVASSDDVDDRTESCWVAEVDDPDDGKVNCTALYYSTLITGDCDDFVEDDDTAVTLFPLCEMLPQDFMALEADDADDASLGAGLLDRNGAERLCADFKGSLSKLENSAANGNAVAECASMCGEIDDCRGCWMGERKSDYADWADSVSQTSGCLVLSRDAGYRWDRVACDAAEYIALCSYVSIIDEENDSEASAFFGGASNVNDDVQLRADGSPFSVTTDIMREISTMTRTTGTAKALRNLAKCTLIDGMVKAIKRTGKLFALSADAQRFMMMRDAVAGWNRHGWPDGEAVTMRVALDEDKRKRCGWKCRKKRMKKKAKKMRKKATKAVNTVRNAAVDVYQAGVSFAEEQMEAAYDWAKKQYDFIVDLVGDLLDWMGCMNGEVKKAKRTLLSVKFIGEFKKIGNEIAPGMFDQALTSDAALKADGGLWDARQITVALSGEVVINLNGTPLTLEGGVLFYNGFKNVKIWFGVSIGVESDVSASAGAELLVCPRPCRVGADYVKIGLDGASPSWASGVQVSGGVAISHAVDVVGHAKTAYGIVKKLVQHPNKMKGNMLKKLKDIGKDEERNMRCLGVNMAIGVGVSPAKGKVKPVFASPLSLSQGATDSVQLNSDKYDFKKCQFKKKKKSAVESANLIAGMVDEIDREMEAEQSVVSAASVFAAALAVAGVVALRKRFATRRVKIEGGRYHST